jgi:hypothetical protein
MYNIIFLVLKVTGTILPSLSAKGIDINIETTPGEKQWYNEWWIWVLLVLMIVMLVSFIKKNKRNTIN